MDLVDEIKPHAENLIDDANGNHVIQKIVEQLKSEQVEFIINVMIGRVYEFSVH